MQGTVSFHPVDLQFFDDLIQPLLAGGKVNPEEYLTLAMRLRAIQSNVDRYTEVLEQHLEGVKPPPPPAEGKLWDKVRARLEQFDYRPDPASVLVARTIDVELHLRGRPFFITEGSAGRVSELVSEYLGASAPSASDALVLEQLVRLHPKLGGQIEPDNREPESPSDPAYRRELLEGLKVIYDLAQAAGQGESWGPPGNRRPALEILPDEIPWRSVVLFSRAVPYWTAHDVDGLDTVCRAAGLPVPDFLVPAWRLFGPACEEFPLLRESIQAELRTGRDIGAFVSPDDIPELLKFLNDHGSAIILAATQAGVGPTCQVLLRKIRECARFAEANGCGYLEASGVPRQGRLVDEEEPVTAFA